MKKVLDSFAHKTQQSEQIVRYSSTNYRIHESKRSSEKKPCDNDKDLHNRMFGCYEHNFEIKKKSYVNTSMIIKMYVRHHTGLNRKLTFATKTSC